ncbi:hypothetical protein IJT10_03995, partial [bacterium]|nr:hypothetical protein [bacterium]
NVDFNVLDKFLIVIFSILSVVIALIIVRLCILKYGKILYYVKEKIKKNTALCQSMIQNHAEKVLIVLSLIFTALYLMKFAPNGRGDFTVRYLFLIMPLFSPMLIFITNSILTYCFHKKQRLSSLQDTLLMLIVVSCIITSNLQPNNGASLRNPRGNYENYQTCFKNSRVVLVDAHFTVQAFTPLLMYATAVYPADNLFADSTAIALKDADLLVVSSLNINKEQVENYLKQKSRKHFTCLLPYYSSVDAPAYYYFYKLQPTHE